jgi:hypothetical protein
MYRPSFKYWLAGICLFVLSVGFSQTAPIQAIEYYFDKDTIGNLHQTIAIDPVVDSLMDFEILESNTADLSKGTHSVSVRTQDTTGFWSFYKVAFFTVGDQNFTPGTEYHSAPIQALEYYFDKDTIGNLHQTVLVEPVTDSLLDFEIEESATAGLSKGTHSVSVRTQDTLGQWSFYKVAYFTVGDQNFTPGTEYHSAPIQALEYYFDKDTIGNLHEIVLIDPVTDSIVDFELTEDATSDLSSGSHTVSVRTQDTLGQWSFYRVARFSIIDPEAYIIPDTSSMIVGFEYWFDTLNHEIGQGNYITIDPPVSTLEEYDLETISVPALPLGEHAIGIRFQDENGYWSHSYAYAFEICLAPEDTVASVTGTTLCDGPGTATIYATGSPTGEYAWYTQSSGGTPVVRTDTTYSPSVSETSTFYVATKGAACNSNRLPVQVDVLNGVGDPTIESIIHCGPNTFDLTPIDGKPVGGTYRWYTSDTAVHHVYEGDFYPVYIDTTTPLYVTGITGNYACESHNRTNVLIAIKECKPQTIVFPAPTNAIFAVTAPQALSAYSVDEFGVATGLPIFYEITEGGVGNGNRAFIRNDSVFYSGIGAVTIRAYQPGDDGFIYYAADDVYRSFTIQADAAEVAIASNSPVCAGDVLELAATVITDGVYTWTAPNGNVTNKRVLKVLPVTEADTGRYNLLVATPTDTLVSSSYVVVKPQAAVVELDVEQVSVCENRSYEIRALGGDFDTYTWTYNNTPLIQTEDSNYTPLFTGVYLAEAVDSNGCSNITKPVYLDLTPDAVPEIAYDTNGFLFTQTFESYQWYVDEFFIVDAEDQQLNLLASGSYKVAGTTVDGCVYISNAFQIVDGGLPSIKTYKHNGVVDFSLKTELSVYPNPVNAAEMMIQSKDRLGILTIVDLTGHVLWSSDMTEHAHKQLKLEVNLESGSYLLINTYHSKYEQTLFRVE